MEAKEIIGEAVAIGVAVNRLIDRITAQAAVHEETGAAGERVANPAEPLARKGDLSAFVGNVGGAHAALGASSSFANRRTSA
jgi:hypothetical protein